MGAISRLCHHLLHPLTSMVALASALAIIGWYGQITDPLHYFTVANGLLFGLQRFWVYWKDKMGRKEKRRLGLQTIVSGIIFATALWVLFERAGEDGDWSIASHLTVLLLIVVLGFLSMIHHQGRMTAKAFHPGLVLISSFIALVVVGGLLLKMPLCTVPGTTISWLHAFFTSTSAVCVTGLAVENTATYFSLTGQWIILILIQVGGLGIMTLTFFAAVVLFEGLSLHDRLLLGRMISENRLARIGKTLSFIVIFTFTLEALGAVILYFSFSSIEVTSERLFHAVFHAISAFCNAGFSTLPDGLASEALSANYVWQMTIMFLIVAGGLGALVCEDLVEWLVAKVKRMRHPEMLRPRLRIHTRLVLMMTSGLIVFGAATIYLTEFIFWDGPSNGGTWMTALFHSVTARTAGFNTVPMSEIGILTSQVLILLMMIGGSPGGTAGGIRTTVFGVGFARIWSLLKNSQRAMIVGNRKIPEKTGDLALGVLVLSFTWLAINFVTLQVFERNSGFTETALLFELVSAFGTVGLSLDATPHLTDQGKMLLIVNMFVGRIGLLTVITALISRDTCPPSGKPEEEIILT